LTAFRADGTDGPPLAWQMNVSATKMTDGAQDEVVALCGKTADALERIAAARPALYVSRHQ
jgi:hypothetical protein